MSQTSNPNAGDEGLNAIEAYLDSLEGGPDAALARLAGKTDPDSMAKRLAILVDANRIQEAAELARSVAPNEKWCAMAVFALANNGKTSPAKEIIEWAKTSQKLVEQHRCLVAYGQGVYARVLHNREQSGPIRPSMLTPEEKDELQDAANTLEPVVAFVKAKSRVENELESQALQQAMLCQAWLGAQGEVEHLACLLYTRKPIPVVLAQLCLMGLAKTPDDLATRLREEQAESLDARILAALIEGIPLKRPENAFGALVREVERTSTDDQRKQLYGALHEVALVAGRETIARVDELAPKLLAGDRRLLNLHEAGKLLRKGETAQAKALLEGLKDEHDHVWLQMHANCLLQGGDGKSATDFLLKACDILPHPDLLRYTASVAFQSGRLDAARKALDEAIRLLPQDRVCRRNAAFVCVQQGDYETAAAHFAALASIEPDERSHALNHAICLARAGNLEDSLKAYEAICNITPPPLQAILGRVQVLRAQNRAVEAFGFLEGVREENWGTVEFIGAYLDLAYAAGKDAEAHGAFLRLRELQVVGKAGPEVLQPKSLDDLKGLLDEQKKTDDSLHGEMLKGKVPWLMADELRGLVSYWGWLVRTQPLKWVWDDPLNRARHCIYATNSFCVEFEEGGKRGLGEIQCAPKGSEVVVDLSSLITLHRLGLLHKAAEYFSRLLIPSDYLAHIMEESGRLVLHQRSQKTALEEIKQAIEQGTVQVLLEAGKPGGRSMPYLHEHTLPEDKNEHYYRITDITEALHKGGLLPNDRYDRVMAVAHKPSGVDAQHAAIELGRPVLVELLTLKTICDCGVLEPVVQNFQIYITDADRQAVDTETRAVVTQEEVYRWHSELWAAIRKDKRFVQATCNVRPELQRGEERLDRGVQLAAMLLAQEMHAPLLADDRVCQAVILNQRQNCAHAAFGTDRLLVALCKNGVLAIDQMADAFLQLLRWRYRFIVPPREVLKSIADRYAAHPPGKDLYEVALYVHDCMRDPGLFGGFEPTEPPMAIANRLHQEWIYAVTELVMDVWADSGFGTEKARELTLWAMQECLPSLPRSVAPGVGIIISSLCPKLVLSRAMIRACTTQDQTRAKQGLAAIADGLGMLEDEFAKEAVEVINVF